MHDDTLAGVLTTHFYESVPYHTYDDPYAITLCDRRVSGLGRLHVFCTKSLREYTGLE